MPARAAIDLEVRANTIHRMSEYRMVALQSGRISGRKVSCVKCEFLLVSDPVSRRSRAQNVMHRGCFTLYQVVRYW